MDIIQKNQFAWKEHNECLGQNTNSLSWSAEEETNENGNELDWLESSDSDSNLDSDFEP